MATDKDDDDDDDDDSADQEFDMDISSFSKKDATDNPSEGADSMFKVSQTDSLFAKGQAVTAQLSTWDKLLEQRILLQKMATTKSIWSL